MKERPILFSAPMVRALLNATKTQTRRVVKDRVPAKYKKLGWSDQSGGPVVPLSFCPYGQPGDRLWVREAFAKVEGQTHPWIATDYRATYTHGDRLGDHLGIERRWTPSIHMPRAASRILLEIVSVRVERLQEISEADAEAEGIETVRVSETDFRYVNYLRADRAQHPKEAACGRAVQSYATLWESINGPGSWAVNPWVWVVEFKRIEAASK